MSAFVHIVDDDDAVRASLYALLTTRSDLLVRNFRSGDNFVAALDEIEPGAVLLDVHMPGASGLDVLKLLREDKRGFGVVVVTGHGDIGTAVQAMKLGAYDFLEKPYDHAELFQAIDLCFERLAEDNLASERAKSARDQMASLSDRELEVLVQLMEGKSNKAVAVSLDVSPRTVEVHRANLMAKLGIGSLPEAVRLAYTAGLLRVA